MSSHTYARAYQAQSILTASPGQLVLLMFDGALRFMAQARAAFAEPEDTPRRLEKINTALLRAQAILGELRSNLDFTSGGEVAVNLDRLYDYYLRRLFECNLRKSEIPLIEVEGLVRELRDGWAEMIHTSQAQAS
jgi:flagellar secretion chaperone FliS